MSDFKIRLFRWLIAGLTFWAINLQAAWAMNPLDSALDLEQTITSITEQAGKTVVSISTQKTARVSSYMRGSRDELLEEYFNDFFYGQTPSRERKQLGLGSGVIIDPRGYILTNEQIINGAEIIKVTLADGRKFDAALKGSDYLSGLAVIKIDADDLAFAEMADSDALHSGQLAIALGNPFGFAVQNSKPTVSFGVISALHRGLPKTASRGRAYLDLIQTDAMINPGNSGGPLLNLKGQLVGINQAIFSLSVGSYGIGFAIPINNAKGLLDKLLKGEEMLYAWMGLDVQDLNPVLADYFGLPKPDGVLIVKVSPDSDSAKAGLENEDIISKFNDRQINNTLDLLKEIAKAKADDEIKLKIIRNALPRTLRIKLGKVPSAQELVVNTSLPPVPENVPPAKVKPQPAAEAIPETEQSPSQTDKSWRGLKVSQIDANFAEMFNLENTLGVIVTEIEPGTQAERAGIKVNDIITQINTDKIASADEFNKSITNVKGNALIKTNRGYLMVQE